MNVQHSILLSEGGMQITLICSPADCVKWPHNMNSYAQQCVVPRWNCLDGIFTLELNDHTLITDKLLYLLMGTAYMC